MRHGLPGRDEPYSQRLIGDEHFYRVQLVVRRVATQARCYSARSALHSHNYHTQGTVIRASRPYWNTIKEQQAGDDDKPGGDHRAHYAIECRHEMPLLNPDPAL